jgi:3-oxoacyl-[acyl-carrier protein] reductase
MGLLDGKTAIITGSARGIGHATAELFASEGAQVTVNDIDGDIAEQAASEIQGDTIAVAGDLTKPGACDEVVQKTVDAFGKVDILVNNAGYTWDGVAHRMSDEQFQAMLDIHLIVPFRMCRAVAPHLRDPAKAERDRGEEVFRKIINITSVSGTMGNAGQVNYSSGKAGVTGLTKTLAKAKEKGETVKAGEGGPEVAIGVPEQMRQMAAMVIPFGRPAQPEEAAGPVLFLASPLANYIHGQVINVTGGQFGGMYC